MAPDRASGYTGEMMNALRIPLLALAVSAAPFKAGAEDRARGLPGVDGSSSVVPPAAEPEADSLAETSPYGEGFVRIPGTDTYVRISGMVRYDIGFAGTNRKADRLE